MGGLFSQLHEAPLNITVALEHEPKAADIVIQFVLLLETHRSVLFCNRRTGKGTNKHARGISKKQSQKNCGKL